MSVSVQNRQGCVLVSSARLSLLATRALAAVGRSGSDVHVTVVDDREMYRLNRRYLGARRPTDVLAFNLDLGAGARASRPRPAGSSPPAAPRARGASLSTQSPEPSRLLGEVVISGETAARQAAQLGVPASLELDLLLVHGLLHLAGYDDHAPAAARLMHERARAILSGSRRRPLPERLFSGLLGPRTGAPSPPRRTFARRPRQHPIRAAAHPLHASARARARMRGGGRPDGIRASGRRA